MFNNRFFTKYLFLFSYTDKIRSKNFINIDPEGFCSSNEENNNVSHCNLCLISELDYFKITNTIQIY